MWTSTQLCPSFIYIYPLPMLMDDQAISSLYDMLQLIPLGKCNINAHVHVIHKQVWIHKLTLPVNGLIININNNNCSWMHTIVFLPLNTHPRMKLSKQECNIPLGWTFLWRMLDGLTYNHKKTTNSVPNSWTIPRVYILITLFVHLPETWHLHLDSWC